MTALASAFKNAQADLDAVKETLEEEVEFKAEMQRALSKATTEAQMWRTKYEQEGIARAEELEEAKRKLTAKLAEAEEQVEQARQMLFPREDQEPSRLRGRGSHDRRRARQRQRRRHGEEAASIRQAHRRLEDQVRGHHRRVGGQPEGGPRLFHRALQAQDP